MHIRDNGSATGAARNAPGTRQIGDAADFEWKKIAYAKVEAQAKENISVDGKQYATVRYEPFIFDEVLYRRKGRLLIWMTDDADHVPVQMRFQMGFPIGSITLELEKHEKL